MGRQDQACIFVIVGSDALAWQSRLRTRRPRPQPIFARLVADPPDDRTPLAQAAEWSSRITTIALEMVVPGLIGLWIDRQLGTVMVFLVLGVAVGMTAGMMHLVRLAASVGQNAPSDRKSDGKPKKSPTDDDPGQS